VTIGQYFALRNTSRNEYVELPGLMKVIERVTNPAAMAPIGYLLLEGPVDGTSFSYRTDLPSISEQELQQAIDEYIHREQEYCEEHDLDQSVYQDDDGAWQRDKIRRVVAAGYQISEAMEYAGRWAGDDVRLVGDYADNDLYSAPNPDWVYEHCDTGEQFTQYATASGPIVESSLDRDDIEHSTRQDAIEPGDLCQVKHPDSGDRVYAYFSHELDTEWTDITDGLLEEFASFVPGYWLEENEDGVLSPDLVVNAD